MRNIKEDARLLYNDQAVKMASKTVLVRNQNKIIDADAEQAYSLALKAAEMKAERDLAPVIVAREW